MLPQQSVAGICGKEQRLITCLPFKRLTFTTQTVGYQKEKRMLKRFFTLDYDLQRKAVILAERYQDAKHLEVLDIFLNFAIY